MSKTIAILGCGWLGHPLAKALVAAGYSVHGATTSLEKIPMLKQEGITPFLLTVFEDKIEGPVRDFLNNTELLIINIPPKLRGTQKQDYVKKMEWVRNAITESTVNKVLFTSSTSVYGDISGIVTEETAPRPQTESGRQLLASENLFKNEPGFQTTIIRFGGLIGKDRHPITMLSGKKELQNGNHPINLIHQNDCIKIILEVIKNDWWNELFNAVYPYNPSKKEYYPQAAIHRGIPVPQYSPNFNTKGKKVESHRLICVKKYTFDTSIQG